MAKVINFNRISLQAKIVFLSAIGIFSMLFIAAPAYPEVYSCYELEGAKVIANDGTYLGEISDRDSMDSIFNKNGQYGNEDASQSIWNNYGSYGGQSSPYSPFNKYTSTPPIIIKRNQKIRFLTVQEYFQDGLDPTKVASDCYGYYDFAKLTLR